MSTHGETGVFVTLSAVIAIILVVSVAIAASFGARLSTAASAMPHGGERQLSNIGR